MVKDICSRCPRFIHCCKFDTSGFVFIGIKDAVKISSKFNLKYKDFLEFKQLPAKTRYLLSRSPKHSEGYLRFKQLVKGKLLVLKTRKNNDCIFYDDGCKIYDSRPLICRIYPYWFFLGEKRHIIAHGEDSGCMMLKESEGLAILKKNESEKIIKLSKDIEAEDKYYRKNIKKFIKNRSL